MIPAGAIESGLLAGCLAVIELLIATKKPPAFRALPWILVLFALDGSAGMLVFGLLSQILQGLTWFVGAWPVLLSGVSGPALLRSQLALLGSGEETSYYGPAVRYRRIQKGVERRIDQLGAVAQSDWIAKALPEVLKIDISEFQLRVTNYVKLDDTIDEVKKHELLEYIEETLTDNTLDPDSKFRAVVQKLTDNGSRQCVKGLVRRAKELDRLRCQRCGVRIRISPIHRMWCTGRSRSVNSHETHLGL
jgi:hypothetical protein